MKLNRVQNAKRNIIFGCMNKFVAIIFPVISRTVLIATLGAEYLGLNSLFTSVLSVLSLSELGFSGAVVYNMYKPVAEGNTETICAILNFYRKVYRMIGCAILLLGVVLIPFLPKLVNGTCPSDISIVSVYLIYLINTAISYFSFAYLSSLLVVYQRDDITSITNMIMTFALNMMQIILLVTVKSYYVYSLMLPLFTLLNNIRISCVVHKIFPQYKCEGKLPKDIIADIKVRVSGSFIGKTCSVSRNSFDSIFISAFLGLTATAMYNNYYYIIGAITAFFSIITSSVLGGVGNSVATEDEAKNYSDMNKMNFLYMWIAGWGSICLLCLYQPFMEIWMGKDLMFPFPIAVLFCVYFYSLKMGDIRTMYVQANGLWWENRYRAIAEVVCNVILNYTLGKYFGVYGIISATIITILLINFGYGSRIIFQYYFTKQNVKEYYLYHIRYMVVTICIGFFTYSVCCLINGQIWFVLFARCIICCLIPNIFYFLIYRRTNIYKEAISWLRRIVRK